MTATLVAHGLAGGYGHRTLFEGIDLTVGPGDVLGIVGANGAGKSTLLRLLAGADVPLSGSLTASPTDAFVGHLPQEHERVVGESVGAYIARRTGCAAATRAMDEAAEALAGPDAGAADAYAAALEQWLASGAADLEDRIPAVLAELGLDIPGTDVDALAMTSLSGGQAARVGLAALLLSRFDIVLLDEPTNDLDLVQRSHRLYGGGYDAFLEERATMRRHAREQYEEFAEKKADLAARARTQREWSSQGVRNAMRKNPDNDRIRRRAVPGRAHPRGPRTAAGPRRERPRPRRPDEPPGPPGDRAAGAGARELRGHAAAGHARPSDARRLHVDRRWHVEAGRVADGA